MAINFSKLRQQNIFDNLGGGIMDTTSPTFPDMGVSGAFPTYQSSYDNVEPSSQPQDDMQKRIDLMNKYFPQTTTAQDRFNSLAGNMPQMTPPSGGRRVTAGLMGLGMGLSQLGKHPVPGNALDDMNKVLYEPYMRDVQAWKEQLAPAQQAATLENQSNNIGRQAGATMVNAEIQDARYRDQQKDAEEKARQAQAKIDETNRHNKETEQTAQRKNEILDLKRTDPSWEFKVYNGNVYANNKKTGETHDTGVKGSDLTDMQKALLGIEGQAFVQTIRNEGAVNTKSTPPGQAVTPQTGKKFSDNQQITMKTAWDAGDRKWLIRNDDKTFDLADKPEISDGTFGFGKVTQEDVNDWQRVHDMIYPVQKSAPANTPPINTGGGSNTSLRMPGLPPASLTTQGFDPGLYKIGKGSKVEAGQPMGVLSGAYQYERNPKNPNIQRRTLDGKTYEYSNDGGVTWTKGAR